MMATNVQSGDGQLITVRDVAQRLAISRRQVWRLVQKGELNRPRKIGRSSRWLARDVVDFIQRI